MIKTPHLETKFIISRAFSDLKQEISQERQAIIAYTSEIIKLIENVSSIAIKRLECLEEKCNQYMREIESAKRVHTLKLGDIVNDLLSLNPIDAAKISIKDNSIIKSELLEANIFIQNAPKLAHIVKLFDFTNLPDRNPNDSENVTFTSNFEMNSEKPKKFYKNKEEIFQKVNHKDFKIFLKKVRGCIQILFKNRTREIITLDVESSETVKNQYFGESNENRSLNSYNIQEYATLQLDLRIRRNIVINLKTENCGSFRIDALSSDTIEDFENKINEQTGYRTFNPSFIFDEIHLEGSRTLASYGIQNNSTIFMNEDGSLEW